MEKPSAIKLANPNINIMAAERLAPTAPETIAKVVQQLVESQNIVKEVTSKLNKADNKKYASQLKTAKSVGKHIDKLINGYLGTIDKRQGITRNPEVTVNQRLSSARR